MYELQHWVAIVPRGTAPGIAGLTVIVNAYGSLSIRSLCYEWKTADSVDGFDVESSWCFLDFIIQLL